MGLKVVAVIVAVLAASLASAAYAGQTANKAGSIHLTSALAFASGATNPSAPGTGAASTDTTGSPTDSNQPSHITIATPAPEASPWSLQDRIKWLTAVLLVLVAYAGVWLGVTTLHKIERQTRYAESAAEAAAESAKAALLLAKAQEQSERPWILITPEPMPGVPDAFTIVATNRGRSPAKVVTLSEGLMFAKDESYLPPEPLYEEQDSRAPLTSMILLPGESAGIRNFRRDDVQAVCGDAEQLRRIEEWDEKLFLYGKVIYIDLRFPEEKDQHQTAWCCWYIHGRQKSGLVTAGPLQYNQHD
jgi:hypothetical protein